MLYKFKSSASGDVIMLGPQGDRVLGLLGRAPAARGIIEVQHIPAALAALRAALAADGASGPDAPATDTEAETAAVGLRQRLWPVTELLERSLAADVPVVWGV
jgi:hypothetical protein